MADWEKIEQGVILAGEIAPEKRAAWLDEFCSGDAELRHEIESLLAHAGDVSDFLESPVVAQPYVAEITAESRVGIHPNTVGPYKLVREIGHGGMGSVYLAVRADNEFNKRVAVKLLRRGMDTEDVLRRFRQERQILAALDHPYIARLLDGGMTDDGLPYFVMEYVDGEPLDLYCAEHLTSTEDKLKLFVKVCSAVSFAHQNLIVHRDLKPSNILVTPDGEPKLLDFGIAKLLNPELAGGTLLPTATFMRPMTPEYASPEQIRGRNVTTASDVYSLGVILFRLLTGENPHKFSDSSPREIERAVCETEPGRPSDVVRSSVSTNGRSAHRGDANTIAGQLRGDLDNIVLMALRKEPERRYQSVADLAADINRHLEGRPVSARPNTLAYRTGKFIARNKIAVAAAALVIVSVVGALAVSLRQADIARRQRDAAEAEKAKAERVSEFLAAALSYSDPSAAAGGTANKRDATINEMLDDIAPKLDSQLADQRDVRAFLLRTIGVAYTAQGRFADARKYLEAALAIHREEYGDEHEETAWTRAALGAVIGYEGDYVNSTELLQRSAEYFRSHKPEKQAHKIVFAECLNVLGAITWTKGDAEGTEKLHREALALAAEIEDRGNVSATAKTGLASALYSKGQLDESVVLLREAAAEYRTATKLRAELPYALNFLGQVLTWKGEYREALDTLRESEKLAGEVWGDDSAYVARSLYLQSMALCLTGDCRAAEQALERCERLYNKIMPGNTVMQANHLDMRNIIYTRTGRAAAGEQFGRQAVELYASSAMKRGASSTTLARLHLAQNLIAQQKYAEAEQVLTQAHTEASEANGPDHWRTREVAATLRTLYTTTGRQELAAKYP